MQDLNAFTVELAMKMVAGTARSMGFTVKGESPFNFKKKENGTTYKKAKELARGGHRKPIRSMKHQHW